jgi:two-component system, OmpR family, phosphate regulon sensor histidine kinase PhoR
MKKTFPIITVLITVSLLGLIFFQILWIHGVKADREQRLRNNVIQASGNAAYRLTEEKKINLFNQKPDYLLAPGGIQLEYKKHSVMQRFTKNEIEKIIREELDAQGTKNVKFVFQVTDNNLNSDQISSTDFMKYAIDTLNFRHVAPLTPPSGSDFENFMPQEFLVLIVPDENIIILKQLTWFIIGAILFTIIIVTAFFLTLRTLFVQKKLGEIKSDFINNMTHEFKTPLATISLAVDALKNEKVVNDKQKTEYFTGVIKEENIRMNKQVEAILQAALLDKQEVQLNLKKLSAHELINDAVNNITLPLNEKNGKLTLSLTAEKDDLLLDEVHFTNIVNNLLDNAVKYCNESPEIKLSTAIVNNQFKLKIEDNGIGMNRETLSRIFEKFYRAHTGNVHNVKGFGLGLSYVKTMVDAHKGTIKAESILGKGTTFTITLPTSK